MSSIPTTLHRLINIVFFMKHCEPVRTGLIHKNLAKIGINTALRTVQRDLRKLEDLGIVKRRDDIVKCLTENYWQLDPDSPMFKLQANERIIKRWEYIKNNPQILNALSMQSTNNWDEYIDMLIDFRSIKNDSSKVID